MNCPLLPLLNRHPLPPTPVRSSLVDPQAYPLPSSANSMGQQVLRYRSPRSSNQCRSPGPTTAVPTEALGKFALNMNMSTCRCPSAPQRGARLGFRAVMGAPTKGALSVYHVAYWFKSEMSAMSPQTKGEFHLGSIQGWKKDGVRECGTGTRDSMTWPQNEHSSDSPPCCRAQRQLCYPYPTH